MSENRAPLLDIVPAVISGEEASRSQLGALGSGLSGLAS
jgi:hypothetical protein